MVIPARLRQRISAREKVLSRLLDVPIAHRGLHLGDSAPENSLAAFKLAMDHGFPIELDVQLLADGNVAVFHDSSLLRMTGRTGQAADTTVAELEPLRLLRSDEKVPLLGEVLTVVDAAVPLLIEIKSVAMRVGTLERAVLELLKPYRGHFALQSFDWRSIAWLRRSAPVLPLGQLMAGQNGVPHYPITRPDFVAHYLGDLSRSATEALRQRNVPLLAWTVKTVGDLAEAVDVADNYIFDASDELLAAMNGSRN